jgi:hypothetical protein
MRWLAYLGTDRPAAFVMRVKRRRIDKRTLLRCLLLDADNAAAGAQLFSQLECGAPPAAQRCWGPWGLALCSDGPRHGVEAP